MKKLSLPLLVAMGLWVAVGCLFVLWSATDKKVNTQQAQIDSLRFGWQIDTTIVDSTQCQLDGHECSGWRQLAKPKIYIDTNWVLPVWLIEEVMSLRYSIDSIHYQHGIDLTAARQRAVEL